MRWILLLASLLGFAVAFQAKTQTPLLIGLVVGFVALIGAFFAMASARVADATRPDSALLTDSDINKLRESVRKNRAAQAAAAAQRPPSASKP
jgi:high-affinity Fe2+/Pb2+ permease